MKQAVIYRLNFNCFINMSVNMKNLSISIALILFAFSFQTAAATSIIHLNVVGQPPLNTSTQEGFLDTVVKEAFRRIGITLQTSSLPAERGLKNSNNGSIDGEMSRVKGIDKVYTNLIRVPEKIMDWEFVVFSEKVIDLSQGWKVFSGKSVSHINGWKILEKNIPNDAEVTKTSNIDELFSLLRKKRTDYVIYEKWAGHYMLRKMPANNIGQHKSTLLVKEVFIYLHKKHKSIVSKLSKSLENMKRDGSYQRLVNKHLSPFMF